jgi:tripartite-type tricarboxylate transporter receptor subunit TctC
MRSLKVAAVGVAAVICTSAMAIAQTYPSKPIQFVIGFSPGGPSDVMSRIITKKMSEVLGQRMVVENRSGASGTIAAQYVARAAPDGYTLMLGTNAALTITPNLQKSLGFDSVKDFTYISLIGEQPDVLYVHPSVPAKTFKEFLELARKQPGKISYGSGGNGTPAHISGELLKKRANIDIQHVPFKGTGPSLQNVIAGQIQAAFNPPSPLVPHIKAGAIRPLAVTSSKRSGALPDVPTIAESGLAGYHTNNWHALVAPAGLPAPIVETLKKALHETLKDPDVKKQLNDLGVDLNPGSPEEILDLVKKELPLYADFIRETGVKIE